MEEEFSFTEDEVRTQLAKLGYNYVSGDKLRQFMIDLQALIDHEKYAEEQSIVSVDQNGSSNSTFLSNSNMAPPEDDHRMPLGYTGRKTAFQKSKVSFRSAEGQENQPRTMRPPLSNYLDLSPLPEYDRSVTSAAESHDSILNSTSESQSQVRRKVARKRNGKTYVLDESSQDSSEASDITVLEERLRTMPLQDQARRHSDGVVSYASRDGRSVDSLPAFIRPATVKPHNRGIKKCDPVSRYHQFKNEWNYFKPPGESNRSALRWNIREQMLNQETFQRPHHQLLPNNYVVPTEKKRQSLRWQVRSTLAGV